MERSTAARTATLTPNHKEGSDLLRAPQKDSHSAGPIHVPQHPVAGLQTTFGNRAVQQMLAPHILRSKHTIGMPHDIHEKEADAIAEQAASTQVSRAAAATGSADDNNRLPGFTGLDASVRSAPRRFEQRVPIWQIPLRTLQQGLGNRALARVFREMLPPMVSERLERKCACGDGAKEGGAESANPAPLQRSLLQKDDDPSAGKARMGTTWIIPTSFSRFFQGSPPKNPPTQAWTKLDYTVQNGR